MVFEVELYFCEYRKKQLWHILLVNRLSITYSRKEKYIMCVHKSGYFFLRVCISRSVRPTQIFKIKNQTDENFLNRNNWLNLLNRLTIKPRKSIGFDRSEKSTDIVYYIGIQWLDHKIKKMLCSRKSSSPLLARSCYTTARFLSSSSHPSSSWC